MVLRLSRNCNRRSGGMARLCVRGTGAERVERRMGRKGWNGKGWNGKGWNGRRLRAHGSAHAGECACASLARRPRTGDIRLLKRGRGMPSSGDFSRDSSRRSTERADIGAHCLSRRVDATNELPCRVGSKGFDRSPLRGQLASCGRRSRTHMVRRRARVRGRALALRSCFEARWSGRMRWRCSEPPHPTRTLRRGR